MNGITVILPVFVRELGKEFAAELERAISSVLSQGVSHPLEVIVVDGSPQPLDSTPECRRAFGDSRVRSFHLAKDLGLVYALNVGLQQARYPLIARIDHDDAWRPGKLAKQLALLESDPDLTIVGTGMRLRHSDPSKDVDLIRKGTWPGVLRTFEDIGCPFPHGSILARREIFEIIGGYPHDPEFAHCEDFALWGVWIRFFKPDSIEEILFDYTVSDTQASAKNAASQRKGSGTVHSRFLSLEHRHRIPDAFRTLAEHLNLSLLETGKLAFTAWKYFGTVLADSEIAESVSRILPDREIVPLNRAGWTLADRAFVLSRSVTPQIPHFRVLVGKESLRSIV